MKTAFFRPKPSSEPDFEADSFAAAAAQAVGHDPAADVPAPAPAVRSLPVGLGALCEDASLEAVSVSENSPAYIDATMIVRGPLETEKDLIIDGRIQGDVKCGGLCIVRGHICGSVASRELRGCGARIRGGVVCKGAVTLDERSAVLGSVRADSAEVNGSVAGDLFLAHACSLGATAYIKGCIHAEFAEIARGAYFEGQMQPVNVRAADPLLAELAQEGEAATAAPAEAKAAPEAAVNAGADDDAKAAPEADAETAPAANAEQAVSSSDPSVTENAAKPDTKAAPYTAQTWSAAPVEASSEIIPPVTADKAAALTAQITASIAEEIAAEYTDEAPAAPASPASAAPGKKPGRGRRR